MKKVSSAVFVGILFGFSAVMLVFSLFASIKLTALNDSAARLDKETAAIEEENRALSAQYGQCASIEEIEKYAVEVLGMQRCTAEQIEYIDMSEQTG